MKKVLSFFIATVFFVSGFIFLPKENVQAATTVTDLNIISSPELTQTDLTNWAKSRGASDTFLSLAALYFKYAPSHGNVNPAIAYIQSALETNFGNFGGVIDASYCNPCGMKTHTGGDDTDPNAHQRFNSWDEGVQAHLDHLALYAGASGYPRATTFDPRHFPSICGIATNVSQLGAKWASSSAYGQQIITLYNAAVSLKLVNSGSTATNTSATSSNAPLIAIDPGHNYGGDTGAPSNINGVNYHEEDLTLDIGVAAKNALLAAGYNVVMTRDAGDRPTSDLNTSLSDKVNVANSANANFFISIHMNAFDGSAHGTEVYTYTAPTQLATNVAKVICDGISQKIDTTNRGVKTANYYVLRNTNMPAILIECAFIDNPSDVAKLSNPADQQLIAQAIVDGIKAGFPISAPAPEPTPEPEPATTTQPGTTTIEPGTSTRPGTTTTEPGTSTTTGTGTQTGTGTTIKPGTNTDLPSSGSGSSTNTADNADYAIMIIFIIGTLGVFASVKKIKSAS